jgi:tRNA threonylcarbamoyladenosine dehydratase
MYKDGWQERSALLLGNEKLDILKNSHVLVVGLGGVGAYAAENICRAGAGKMTIADGDVITPSNINRQLPAVHSSVGIEKSVLMAARLRDINPSLELDVVNKFLKHENIRDLLDSQRFDYVVDAIDTLTPKIHLILETLSRKYPLISSMGAGGRIDPSYVQVADISKSHNCRLAFILRKRLRRLGISSGFDVVFSSERNDRGKVVIVNEQNKKSAVGTISYMPALFGCLLASVVIRGLIEKGRHPGV